MKTDKIYLRPEWYLTYVKNLAWLIARKYNLDESKLNMNIFQQMTNFATKNQCSLKGIIDYEITKKLGQTKFYIPVLYPNPDKIITNIDAHHVNEYLELAKENLKNSKQYIEEDNIYKHVTDILILKFRVYTGNRVFETNAFEVNLNK